MKEPGVCDVLADDDLLHLNVDVAMTTGLCVLPTHDKPGRGRLLVSEAPLVPLRKVGEQSNWTRRRRRGVSFEHGCVPRSAARPPRGAAMSRREFEELSRV